MAVGRISGPLLKSNLLRNGVDLAFQTDLLYLDVNNSRIGVKTATPQYDLDVNGTTRSTDLITTGTAYVGDVRISGNTIDSVSGDLNLSTVGSDKVVALKTLEVDDLRFDTNVISSTVSNADIDIIPHGSGKVDIQSDLAVTGNIDITGNLVADGDITISGNVQIGDEATDTISITAGITSDLKPDASATYNLGTPTKKWNSIHASAAYIDDLQIDTNVIQNTVSNADLELFGNGTGGVVIDALNHSAVQIAATFKPYLTEQARASKLGQTAAAKTNPSQRWKKPI